MSRPFAKIPPIAPDRLGTYGRFHISITMMMRVFALLLLLALAVPLGAEEALEATIAKEPTPFCEDIKQKDQENKEKIKTSGVSSTTKDVVCWPGLKGEADELNKKLESGEITVDEYLGEFEKLSTQELTVAEANADGYGAEVTAGGSKNGVAATPSAYDAAGGNSPYDAAVKSNNDAAAAAGGNAGGGGNGGSKGTTGGTGTTGTGTVGGTGGTGGKGTAGGTGSAGAGTGGTSIGAYAPSGGTGGTYIGGGVVEAVVGQVIGGVVGQVAGQIIGGATETQTQTNQQIAQNNAATQAAALLLAQQQAEQQKAAKAAQDAYLKQVAQEQAKANEASPKPTTPVSETPASETPVSETPASETPAPETPASETPASETPTSGTPTSGTPTSGTPTYSQTGSATSGTPSFSYSDNPSGAASAGGTSPQAVTPSEQVEATVQGTIKKVTNALGYVAKELFGVSSAKAGEITTPGGPAAGDGQPINCGASGVPCAESAVNNGAQSLTPDAVRGMAAGKNLSPSQAQVASDLYNKCQAMAAGGSGKLQSSDCSGVVRFAGHESRFGVDPIGMYHKSYGFIGGVGNHLSDAAINDNLRKYGYTNADRVPDSVLRQGLGSVMQHPNYQKELEMNALYYAELRQKAEERLLGGQMTLSAMNTDMFGLVYALNVTGPNRALGVIQQAFSCGGCNVPAHSNYVRNLARNGGVFSVLAQGMDMLGYSGGLVNQGGFVANVNGQVMAIQTPMVTPDSSGFTLGSKVGDAGISPIQPGSFNSNVAIGNINNTTVKNTSVGAAVGLAAGQASDALRDVLFQGAETSDHGQIQTTSQQQVGVSKAVGTSKGGVGDRFNVYGTQVTTAMFDPTAMQAQGNAASAGNSQHVVLASKVGSLNADNPYQPVTIPLGQSVKFTQTNGGIEVKGFVSGFGERTSTNSFHAGGDWTGRPEILASGSGRVVRSDCTGGVGYGCQVVVYHGKINGKDTYTQYAHLAQMNVKEGDTVAQGQQIGVMGSSGTKDGALHLHSEIRIGNNTKYAAVDPLAASTSAQLAGSSVPALAATLPPPSAKGVTVAALNRITNPNGYSVGAPVVVKYDSYGNPMLMQNYGGYYGNMQTGGFNMFDLVGMIDQLAKSKKKKSSSTEDAVDVTITVEEEKARAVFQGMLEKAPEARAMDLWKCAKLPATSDTQKALQTKCVESARSAGASS